MNKIWIIIKESRYYSNLSDQEENVYDIMYVFNNKEYADKEYKKLNKSIEEEKKISGTLYINYNIKEIEVKTKLEDK